MAITIITQPNQYHSGYNPIKYVIDSDNKNTAGFRYIVEIFDAGTSNKLVELDVIPDPTNSGRAEIDISRIIRNKLDKFLNLNTNTVADATTTYYKYDIKFGESLVGVWNFTDYGLNLSFNGGNTGLFQSPQTTPHTFVVGDQVAVETNITYNDNRSSLNGLFSVIGVVNAYDIVISLTDVGSFPATPGKVRFADNRKVRNYNLTSVSNRIAVNTALDLKEFVITGGSLSTYIQNNASNKFLTNAPNGFKVTPIQTLYINMLEADNAGFLYIENSNGDVFRKVNGGGATVKASGVGPGNFGSFNIVSGTGPIIKDNTEWYEIWTTNLAFDRLSEKKRFVIDRRCRINDIEILFMDRKGSFMGYSFPLKSFENIDISKEMYSQHVGSYTYTSAGMTTFHSEFNKTLKLNTNFMTDDMNRYFEELLTSGYTFVKWEGTWYSCFIEGGSFETERFRNKRLLRRGVEVKFSLENPINI